MSVQGQSGEHMAGGEQLKNLFRSYQHSDDVGFRAAAMEIIAEEQRKNHHALARDLQRILESGTGRAIRKNSDLHDFDRLPRDRERETVLVDVRAPERYLDDIVLSDTLHQQIAIILDEFRSSSVLQTYGLHPRRKLLFCGPPGCGKTVGAEAIAGELGLSILYTRFDAVISSFLGETASNLRKVFDYAARGKWVVFFDEFDAIGKSRDDTGEHGELKRVVNTFLQLLDNFASDSLFIAATNHQGLLDEALWRRFDDILYFGEPNQEQIYAVIQIKLRGFRHKDLKLESFVPRMVGWAHADVERVCIEAMKISILSSKDKIDNASFSLAFERQLHRSNLVKDSVDSNG
jgi:SpoVK/Ycf46/Vps4 family AAA+-type ATPase